MSKGYLSASPLATHRFVQGTMPRASSLELIRTMLNGMHGIGGIRVRLVADGIVVEGGGGLPFAFRVIGYDSDEQLLSLEGGLVQHGNGIFYLDPAEVTMTGNPAFVVMKVDKNNLSNTAWLPSAVSSVPADTPQHAYIPFYEYELTEGDPPSHSLKLVHHTGSVRI